MLNVQRFTAIKNKQYRFIVQEYKKHRKAFTIDIEKKYEPKDCFVRVSLNYFYFTYNFAFIA